MPEQEGPSSGATGEMPGAGMTLRKFVETKNREYEAVHLAFENQFWGNKMNLKTSGDFTPELLSETKQKMEAWLANPELRVEQKMHLPEHLLFS